MKANGSEESVVGVWLLERIITSDGLSCPTQEHYELRFEGSGRYEIRRAHGDEHTTVRGSYSIDHDTISRWVDPGVQLQDFRYHAAADELDLIFPDGRVFTLRRFSEDRDRGWEGVDASSILGPESQVAD